MNDFYMYGLLAGLFGLTTAWTSWFENAKGTASNGPLFALVSVVLFLFALVMVSLGYFSTPTPALTLERAGTEAPAAMLRR